MNKKRKQSFFALLTTMLIVLSTTISALASSLSDPSAVFSEGKTMVFTPGSTYTDTDLFGGFKGVMPGDVQKEEILVKNQYQGFDGVKIYLRAEAHDETTNPLSAKVAASGETVATMSDFLSQLSMKVWNGDALIYEGAPNELDGLKEPVLLGKFRRGESTKLIVELAVPMELGNEYANRVGEVDWIFQIEQYSDPKGSDSDPSPDSKPQSEPEDLPSDTIIITDADVPLAAAPDDLPFGVLPATGDTTAIVPYLCLLAVGICGLFITLIAGRKKRKEISD